MRQSTQTMTNPMYQGPQTPGNSLQPQAMYARTPTKPAAPVMPKAPAPVYNPIQAKPSFNDYPSYIYSPQQTEREINLQTALAQQRASLPNILEQFAGQGFNTNSPAIYAQALQPMLNARVNDIAPRQQFADSLANSQFSLQNQGLQHQDTMQNARMQEMLRQIQFGGQFGQFQDLATLLGRLLG